MRSNLSAAVRACALALGGCALAPPDFRVVPAEQATDNRPLKNFVVLAPGVRAAGGDLYSIDIALASSPWRCPSIDAGGADFRARVLTAGIDAAVLRVTTMRHETEAQLRQAWETWRENPKAAPITRCLAAQDLNAIPNRLAAARPVDGEQSLESALGISASSRLVTLAPGMTVCATDGFKRNSTADAYIPTGPFCARVAGSPIGGMALDPIRYTLGTISGVPSGGSAGAIRSIASWAEVPRDAHPREYVVRYPTALPPAGDARPRQVSLLVSLGTGLRFDVRQAAMRCIASAERVSDFCESPLADIPGKCENAILAEMTVKPQCYRFGERGVMNVSIPVLINEVMVDVEAGSLVRDAAARLGRSTTGSPNMTRWYGAGQHPVQFEVETFDVPLLPGDTLSW